LRNGPGLSARPSCAYSGLIVLFVVNKQRIEPTHFLARQLYS
jgi:hypothetical protein